jgi:hypothetical protein
MAAMAGALRLHPLHRRFGGECGAGPCELSRAAAQEPRCLLLARGGAGSEVGWGSSSDGPLLRCTATTLSCDGRRAVAERPGGDGVGKLPHGRPRCGRRWRLELDGVWTRGGSARAARVRRRLPPCAGMPRLLRSPRDGGGAGMRRNRGTAGRGRMGMRAICLCLLETMYCEGDCKYCTREAKVHLPSIFALHCWS